MLCPTIWQTLRLGSLSGPWSVLSSPPTSRVPPLPPSYVNGSIGRDKFKLSIHFSRGHAVFEAERLIQEAER